MNRKWWTLLVVSLGTFMLLMDIMIVNVALPSIQRDLHASFADLQWTVDAYSLTFAALLLLMGSLADRYGRRLLFAIGLGVFTAGSAACAAAASPLMLILFRAGQGIGGAIMFAVSLALLAQAFQGRERGLAFAVWGAVIGVATAVGPAVGGVITTYWDWRGIFIINLPIGAAAVILTLAKVGESRSPRGRPDWAGCAAFTAALTALVYGLIRAGQYHWGEAGVITCLACAAALLAAFVVIESRTASPMLSLALFKVPTFAGGSVAAFAVNGCVFSLFLYFVLWLQDSLGYDAVATGVRLLVYSAATLPVSLAFSYLSARIPVRWLIGAGLALCAAGLALMAGIGAGSGWTHLIPGLIVTGIGTGLVNPGLASTAVGVVHPRDSGMASGANSTFRQVGVAAGIATFGTLFTARLASGLSASLAGTPAAGQASRLAAAISEGSRRQAIAAAPASLRPQVAHAAAAAFASGMNEILLVSAVAAAVFAVAATILIRARDFHPAAHQPPQPASPAAQTPAA